MRRSKRRYGPGMMDFLTAVLNELLDRDNRPYLILLAATAALSAILWLLP